jgi:hypothetical protein
VVQITRRGLIIGTGAAALFIAADVGVLSSVPPAVAAACWVWPNGSTSTPHISSPYGPREAPTTGATTYHRGVDLTGFTRNRAAGDGEVVFAGNDGGYGVTVRINHGRGMTTVYAHNASGSLTVTDGDNVTAGQILGTMGATGNVTGVHLHFETRINGEALNPVSFMAARISECGGSTNPQTLIKGEEEDMVFYIVNQSGHALHGRAYAQEIKTGKLRHIQFPAEKKALENNGAYFFGVTASQIVALVDTYGAL